MTDTLSFTFNCTKCGGLVTWPEDIADETPLSCKNCDVSLPTYGEAKALAMEKAKEYVSHAFQDAFKGLKGWKLS